MKEEASSSAALILVIVSCLIICGIFGFFGYWRRETNSTVKPTVVVESE
jgi:hypothetical protein